MNDFAKADAGAAATVVTGPFQEGFGWYSLVLRTFGPPKLQLDVRHPFFAHVAVSPTQKGRIGHLMHCIWIHIFPLPSLPHTHNQHKGAAGLAFVHPQLGPYCIYNRWNHERRPAQARCDVLPAVRVSNSWELPHNFRCPTMSNSSFKLWMILVATNSWTVRFDEFGLMLQK